ncbi:ferredoxin--NADP reductase [Flocculibacter collagenilyticus]|uniref:ferredoxin--NADP reductase n=1 Tax=Flocculibacter collagenilyticus TaxID=2744479 RepID=UPI0018F6949E|nr:ferredoxin--NADP reductase [Flocculibacter collagenilyticus]
MSNESALKNFVKGQVTKKTQWNESLFSLEVSAEIAPYIAGQFCKLALQNGNGDWLRRAYSFVNPPSTSTHEFLITEVNDGGLSPLLAKLNVGDDIWLTEKSSGFLTIEEIPMDREDLWLLSTGSAIGPFLSILADTNTSERFQRLVLVHAVRYQQDLVYKELIEKLKQELGERFSYIPVVSREDYREALLGRIPVLIEDGQLLDKAGFTFSPETSFFMICGNPNMVKDTTNVLIEQGFEKNLRRKPGHIATENYW